MRCVLHVGTPKTGSSTIQKFLKRNRPELMKRGVLTFESLGKLNNQGVAIYARDDRHVDGGHIRFGAVEPEERAEFRRDLELRFAEEIETLRARHGGDDDDLTAVISAEHLWQLQAPSEFARLRELLDAHFDSYRVVVYLRRQDRKIVSSYSTQLRAYAGRVTPLTFEGAKVERYDAALEHWATAFGDDSMAVRVFERERLVEGDLLADFCDAVGVPWSDAFERVGRANPSLNAEAQEFLRCFNAHVPPFLREEREVNPLRGDVVKILDRHFEGRGAAPSRAEAEAFYAQAREANERVAARWFGGEPLFSEDFSEYPEIARHNFLFEEAVEVAAILWQEKQQEVLDLRARLAEATGATSERSPEERRSEDLHPEKRRKTA